jgi:hypothetical protein
MRTPGWVSLALLGSCTAAAAAQPVVVGQLRSKAQTALTLPSGPLTLIDLSSPATASGDVTSVTVQWVGGGVAPCTPGMKLKFFRPVASGGALTYLGERGPFASLRGLMVIPISPPMALQAHDLIGVTEFGNAICGGVGMTDTGIGLNSASFLGDVSGDTTLAQASSLLKTRLSIQGLGGATEVRTAIVPVALSSPGLNGSLFKTGLQMTNPGLYTISGRLVFHAQSQPGSPSDPSVPFSLAAGETRSFADIVAAIGQTGSGSLDVYSTDSPPPLLVTRVFNDAGAAGTSGFTEPAVAPENALQAFDSARLTAPADPNFRMNVGVRTLSLAASLTVTVYSASGTPLSTIVKSYPAEYFEQVSAAAFVNATSLGANQTISILVNSGSAIVYAAAADNRTNDPSMQIGNRDDF